MRAKGEAGRIRELVYDCDVIESTKVPCAHFVELAGKSSEFGRRH